MLYDAAEAFEDGDPKVIESPALPERRLCSRAVRSTHQADENIRSIEHAAQLADAVQANMLAAVSEFEPEHQKKYLKVNHPCVSRRARAFF
jgi:hypothetical protein